MVSKAEARTQLHFGFLLEIFLDYNWEINYKYIRVVLGSWFMIWTLIEAMYWINDIYGLQLDIYHG